MTPITARLVHDGGQEVWIPQQMGTPRADQMKGTPAERLIELAGRVCYDSLGKGRPSFGRHEDGKLVQGYHDHIRETNNGSVWEHANFTVRISFGSTVTDDNRKLLIAWHCANRPGVLVLPTERNAIEVTLNIRSVIEWQAWTAQLYGRTTDQFNLDDQLAETFSRIASYAAPGIFEEFPSITDDLWPELQESQYAEPSNDHQAWISMFISGSRGMSHELVRHGDFTAISQRSTRYVDESEADWIRHPLLQVFLDDAFHPASNGSAARADRVLGEVDAVIKYGRDAYRTISAYLEEFLKARGIEKLAARKQARGAARGYLGNALYTELIFSASVAQWKRMLRQRASALADAEIREVFCEAFRELKRSRYGSSFDGWTMSDSPDGIGKVVSPPAYAQLEGSAVA